tara:strand:+ start:894 stop:1184 length:291 start_codon:yes stop_codon:yes gene_type:complete
MAIDFFVSDRVVCKDFDAAMKLQRELKCQNLITLDGTEFKLGMISGGHHSQNLFDLNLGSAELDRDIKKLSSKVQRLVEDLKTEKAKLQEAVNKEF